jgi:hypothetical protein
VKGNQNLTVESAAIDRFRGNVIYRDQEILVERVHISSEKNHIILSGSVPMTEEKMNLRLDARLDDMGILSFVNRDITESSGSGVVGATITGNLRKMIAKEEPVRFVGSCRFSDLGVNFDRAYMKFEGLKVNVEFDSQSLGPDRGFIALRTFRGKMNDGEFYLSSEASVNPGAEIIWEEGNQFRIGEFRGISVKMTDFLLNDPMVYSAKFNGEVSLKGTFDAPEIAGDVTVDSGEYVESMDNLVQRLLSTREIGVKAFLDYPLVQDLQLNIEVRAPGNVWMKNEIVDAQAKVTARVRGSLADPIVMAQANIVNGKIYYFGPEFEIIEGSIKNESRIDPQYDITAEMEITNLGDTDTSANGSSKQTLEMKLKGSLSEVQPPVFTLQGGGVTQQRYTMSAEDKDIMTILTLGSTSDEFLSKTAEWYLGNKAAKHLSLKEFQMQVDLNINDPKETRLMVARQLMDRMSVRLDVGYRGQQWIGLQYEMSKHFDLAGELSQYGDWGLDLEVKRDFQ